MSIHLSESNFSFSGRDPENIKLVPGSAAFNKGSNRGFVVGMWLRTLPQGAERNVPRNILARGNGLTSGNDSFLRFATNDETTLEFQVRDGGSDLLSLTQVSTPGLGVPYLAMIIQTAANLHLVTCEEGGVPIVTTRAGQTGLYANNPSNRGGLFSRIGTNQNDRAWYGDMENLFYCFGEFPETGGAPDTALIQALANGTQEIAGLESLMTDGLMRFHYPMLHRNDYTNAAGGAVGDMRVAGAAENADTGQFYYSGGHLRPGALRPTEVGHWISPLSFTERGDIATATATIRAEGGSYHGITPAAIQARLVKEDGSAHVDWTVIDSAPSGGTWASADFTAVAATPGFLELHFRAVDAAGQQIGGIIPSKGLRGTGFAFHSQQCQSQGMYIWENTGGTGRNFATGLRMTTVQIKDGGTVIETMHSTSNGDRRNRAAGIGFAANEIQTAFPGYPIQMATLGESGTSGVEFDTGGDHFNRWATLGAYYGIEQPDPHIMHLGHSQGPAGYADYLTMLENTVGHCEAQLGSAAKVLLAPTPRYSAANSGTASVLYNIRNAMRSYFDANAKAYHLGSFAVVFTGEGGSDPHPSGDSLGQGRTGGLIGLGVMAAQGAIAGPAEIKSKSVAGTTVTLNLGDLNA